MGTNYYVVRNRPTTDDPIHIGKNSYGWLFLFEAHNDTWADPPIIWNTFDQVKEWLKKYTIDSTDYVIIDEYDEIVPYDEFVSMVETNQNDVFSLSNEDNFKHCRNVNGYRFSDQEFS